MAADKWVIFDSFLKAKSDGTLDLDSDVVKALLYTSSLTPNKATQSKTTDLTGEVATGNGYTEGGEIVAATFTRSGSTTTFDVADPSWTASGGSIVARYCVLVIIQPVSPVVIWLIGYSLLDNTPADVTATDGTPLTVTIDAAGVFSETVSA